MRLRKPSPAMLVALLALFVALGGSSYAAVVLSKNSVRSKHIAKGAVKRSEIARSAVNSAKVADGSLLATDFNAGQLPAGPQGPPGPQGDKGDRGESATKLFGSISDAGASPAAVLVYASGVTGVSESESRKYLHGHIRPERRELRGAGRNWCR